MRFTALYILLSLLGLFILVYSLSSLSIIDWEVFGPLLEQQSITTNSEVVSLIGGLYSKGLLDKYLNQQALLAFLVSVGFIFVGIIGTFHLTIDKLFFKKFYENPDQLKALRRALLWGAVPPVLLLMIVKNIAQVNLLVVFILLVICVEILLSAFIRK
jgi:hypothetical protein